MRTLVHNVLIAQVVKRYERRRVVETEHRIIDGTPAHVETLQHQSQGGGVINTAYIERLNATFRERLAPLARRCRALARHPLTLHKGMFLVGTVSNCCTPHESLSHTQQTTPAMAAGSTDHASQNWRVIAVRSCRFLDFAPLPPPFLRNSLHLVLHEHFCKALFELKQAPCLKRRRILSVQVD